MSRRLTRDEAWDLLCQYNKVAFHLKHAQIVEGVMEYYAEQLGYGDEKSFWGLVGLLHDLDFEMYPEEHCIKSQGIMRENNLDERLIRATASHGYGFTTITAMRSLPLLIECSAFQRYTCFKALEV